MRCPSKILNDDLSNSLAIKRWGRLPVGMGFADALYETVLQAKNIPINSNRGTLVSSVTFARPAVSIFFVASTPRKTGNAGKSVKSWPLVSVLLSEFGVSRYDVSNCVRGATSFQALWDNTSVSALRLRRISRSGRDSGLLKLL